MTEQVDTPTHGNDPLVLIIDDDALIRDLAGEALARSGFSVAQAENGRHGLLEYQRLLPDIVLLDVMMPELDGFSVCRAIRALPGGSETPILVMTGLEDSSAIDEAYQAGATDFIPKPMSWNILCHRVRYMLRSNKAMQELRISEARLAQKTQEIENLNQSLTERVENAVLALRQRDQVLFQQSRLAAMGEMINNIAHQWRQPLNNIGLIIQNLQLSIKCLSEAEIERDISGAMKIIQHMSSTIDDFRNFFRQDKEKLVFSVIKAVELTTVLIAATLDNHYIDVETHLEKDVQVIGYENEYTQALLNIISNAKDVLLERKPKNPRIVIRVSGESCFSVVTIHDNGGGIDADILPRIFDPFFSTKGPTGGTGIGLYMSKMIIEKNMRGKLTVANRDDGAEFRIELPAA